MPLSGGRLEDMAKHDETVMGELLASIIASGAYASKAEAEKAVKKNRQGAFARAAKWLSARFAPYFRSKGDGGEWSDIMAQKAYAEIIKENMGGIAKTLDGDDRYNTLRQYRETVAHIESTGLVNELCEKFAASLGALHRNVQEQLTLAEASGANGVTLPAAENIGGGISLAGLAMLAGGKVDSATSKKLQGKSALARIEAEMQAERKAEAEAAAKANKPARKPARKPAKPAKAEAAEAAAS